MRLFYAEELSPGPCCDICHYHDKEGHTELSSLHVPGDASTTIEGCCKAIGRLSSWSRDDIASAIREARHARN